MIFDDMQLIDTIDVEIDDDPYSILLKLNNICNRDEKNQNTIDYSVCFNKTNLIINGENRVFSTRDQICLRLYSYRGKKRFVANRSGLNQWNGVRTSNYTRVDGTINHRSVKRDVNEIYIPYPAEDRRRTEGFFPSRKNAFKLQLPSGEWIEAKICQQDGKAIMSNPNNQLGKWLLRDVFELPEGTVVTYDMLMEFNIDSVIFTKITDERYSIEFGTLGTYEEFYGTGEFYSN